ncbi:MAG TPA: hypothetical protein ENK57_16615 [Polyangiaceae bacterium]|nr:hypothetical protein [Polyangiaceae bacterium]
MLGTLDAAALFRSSAANDVGRIVTNLVPVGPESNFVAQRDVQRVYGAVYAMQGADFVAVVQGNFDLVALENAARARAQTPSGAPLVVTPYGDESLYTVANIGFVPLTNHTMLSGNETGMRRALDQLRYGQQGRGIPDWMRELLEQAVGGPPRLGTPGAPPVAAAVATGAKPAFAMVGDVAGQGVVAAAGDRLPFLSGLGMIRVLGNFEAPGMNLVGSLTYADEQTAAIGSERLSDVQKLAYLASLMATWGFGGRMPEMEVRRQGTHVSFATELDTSLMSIMLRAIADVMSPGKATPPTFWGG